MNSNLKSCMKALALTALGAIAIGFGAGAANAQSCGSAKIANVTPASSTLSGSNQFWNVSPGTTVTITLTGVTDCANRGTDATIQVIVQSSATGNVCRTATKGTTAGCYTFTYDVPNNGCNTMVISYCTSNCSTSTGKFAKDANGNCQGHLRVGTSTGAACTPTISGCKNTDLGCLTADPTITCANAGTVGGYTVTGSTICGGTLPVSCTAGSPTGTSCARSQTFTYAATNACGQSAVCYAKFTWSVHTAPVFDNLPTGGDRGCNNPPSCVNGVTAHDNCQTGIVATCTPGDVTSTGCQRSQTFTYSATNCAGQNTSTPVTYTWSVVTKPVLVGVPDGGPLGCNPTKPTCSNSVSAMDECGALNVTCTDHGVTGDACHRSQTFTYSATNCADTASKDVTYTWSEGTVTITVPGPANVCKEDYVAGDLFADANGVSEATGVDSCGNDVTVDFSDSAPTTITCDDGRAGFTILRTWTATSTCGVDTGTQLITVCPCGPVCVPFGGDCTVTLGYWKTHGPGNCVKGHNSNDWPTQGTVIVGCTSYDLSNSADTAALCTLLSASGQHLIPQLIAAQLNIIHGATTDPSGVVALTIAQANDCLCHSTGDCSAFTSLLDAFNSGTLAGGPPHCGTCPTVK